MKIELSNPVTRFLALSAIALTLASAPSRADWSSVRPDGTIVTVSSSLKVSNDNTSGSTQGNAQNARSTDTLNSDDYAADVGDAGDLSVSTNAPNVRPQARSARVQQNRNRLRERNNNRRNGNDTGDAGYLQPLNGGNGFGGNGLDYGVNPSNGLGYGAAVAYPNYPGYAAPGYNYNVPAYPYGAPGFGYNYPTGVLAPGATVVLPQTPFTVPIAPAPYPWVQPPTFTSIPIGGTTIITNPGYNGYRNDYPHRGPANCAPYPSASPPYGYPAGYGYPSSYGYPDGTYTQSYGGLSISHGGVSISVGGTTTSTQTTWGTGLYR